MNATDGAVGTRRALARGRLVAWCFAAALALPCARAASPPPGPADPPPAAGAAPSGVDPGSTVAIEPSRAAASARATATLRVYNRPIVAFRAPLFGAPPAERALRARERIDETLALGGPGRVAAQPHPVGRIVLVDGRLAFVLQASDVDLERGETLEAATAAAVARLEEAIGATRASRDLAGVGHGLLRVLMYTAIAAALVWASGVAVRAAARRLMRAADSGASRLRVGGLALLQRDTLTVVIRHALVGLRWVLLGLVAYHWVGSVLRAFAYTRPWGEQLHGFLLGLLGSVGQAALNEVPDLLVAVLIFVLASGASRAAGAFLARAARVGTIGWLDRDTLGSTRRLVTLGIWLFALAMAYPYLPGSDTEAFRGLSVLLGLMISLGGSSLVGQAASGLVLMYTRTLSVGEYVQIDGHEGTVVALGAFRARIRTGMGEELSLPNALVMSTVTRNYSRAVSGPGYVVSTDVTIGYDTPWRQVHAMLIEAARRTPGVLADPPPRVVQTALSDFYPQYRLICQAIPAEPRPRADVLGALHANVQDVFNEYGVQIMSPHYVADPDEAKLVPPSRRAPPPAREAP